jgi:hypothetical protein
MAGRNKIMSARGEEVDFQLLQIKQQLADAPQNLEVARRQAFIDNKEKNKSVRKKIEPPVQAPIEQSAPPQTNVVPETFENENGDVPDNLKGTTVEPIPVIDRG